MRIISTFMYSELHEQDLLWLKLNIEDPFISEWIIVESNYTFQGQKKTLYLADILTQPRFDGFKNKIHHIVLDQNFNFEYEPSLSIVLKRKIKRVLTKKNLKQYEFEPYAELASFHAEINQRQAPVEYIKNKYSKDDVVLACDCDEIFDFNGEKIDAFISILNTSREPFYIKREVFCYDFVNFANRLRYSPIVRVKDIVGSEKSLHEVRHPNPQKRKVIPTPHLMAFEYTYCFKRDDIMRKLKTFAHVTDLNEEAVDFCLENNIALTNPKRIDATYLKNSENAYKLLVLNSENAPIFLLENIDYFKTNIVSEKYLEQRKNNSIEFNY